MPAGSTRWRPGSCARPPAARRSVPRREVSDNSLAADPALLADEARSLSLLGGRRVVWVAPAGRGFQGAMESYLADPRGRWPDRGRSRALQKSSKAAHPARAVQAVCVIACYEDSAEDLRALVRRAAAEARLAISDDVVEHIVDRIGSDRALSRREIEKLLLYCHGRESIELDRRRGGVRRRLGRIARCAPRCDLWRRHRECCRRLAQLAEAAPRRPRAHHAPAATWPGCRSGAARSTGASRATRCCAAPARRSTSAARTASSASLPCGRARPRRGAAHHT
jgi:hypothetical protein